MENVCRLCKYSVLDGDDLCGCKAPMSYAAILALNVVETLPERAIDGFYKDVLLGSEDECLMWSPDLYPYWTEAIELKRDELKEIFNHFGEKHQMIKLVEEMGELTAEIGRYVNNSPKASVTRLRAELYDVVVVAAQLLNDDLGAAQDIQDVISTCHHRFIRGNDKDDQE